MKIAVDLTSLSGNLSGLERYAANITDSMIRLSRNSKGHGRIEWILVVRNSVPLFVKRLKDKPHGDIRVVMVKGGKLFINQLKLPAVMKGIKADVYLFPSFPVPLLSGKKKGKRIYGLIADTAVFDVPDTMKFRSRLLFGMGLRHTAAVSDGIITISEFSASRIRSNLKPKGKILLAPCAADDRLGGDQKPEGDCDRFREKYDLPERYILAFSTLEPRKNTGLIAKAYGSLIKGSGDMDIPPLVLAGRNGWKMKEEMERICGELGERVLVPGFIDDEDIDELYAHADMFIDASVYEGFDMPPLEAMKCNVKNIIISDIPVHHEVFGDAVLYFKSGDETELAGLMRKCILGDEDIVYGDAKTLSERYSQDKRMNILAGYSWDKSAAVILDELMGEVL